MGSITILNTTTKYPITTIGQRAGVCYGSNTTDSHSNLTRGIDCLKSQHGRPLEFVNIEMILDGYSARVIREWYTHIGGSPTRLQSSTRYIDYSDFKYVVPPSIMNNDNAIKMFEDTMNKIKETCSNLNDMGIPKEDIAMALPLGMETRVVDKRNLRNLIDMSHQRMCTRAYWEFRQLFRDILNALSSYSEEWKFIVETEMKPKCAFLGHCPERNSCSDQFATKGDDLNVADMAYSDGGDI